MGDDLTAVANRIAASTHGSVAQIEHELEKLEARGSPPSETEQTITARFLDSVDSTWPWDLAGVGLVRGHSLFDSGYRSAEAVAAASIEELGDLDYLSEASAACIREVARNECDYSSTMAGSLAAELGVPRRRVAEAYEALAPQIILPEDAAPTLRKAFDDPQADSVFTLDIAFDTTHHLYVDGLLSVTDVAEAPLSRLEELPYHGRARAERLREHARETLESRSEHRDTSVSSSSTESGEDGIKKPDSSKKSCSSDDRSPGEERLTSETDGSGPSSSKSDASDERPVYDQISEVTEDISPDTEGYPRAMVAQDQWLLWKQTDDGRKIPRAPWETGDPLRYVSAMDPTNWTSFGEAWTWQETLLSEFGLAFSLTRDDEFVFIDLDDVVTDGNLSEAAQGFTASAGSYAAISTSGTGAHVFVQGSLSDEVKSLTGSLSEESDTGSLEVYDRNRFVAMTGRHITTTPTEITSNESFLRELEADYAKVSSETPDRVISEPTRDREELQDMETTSDIQDLFDAIHQTRPSDIQMRSTMTREHGDGTYSYDPSWVYSESGTRLGVLDDVWIYRQGMIALDALQLVALEEGIISDETTYPAGEDFWTAVESLRDRGANLPWYEPKGTTLNETESARDDTKSIDRWKIARILNHSERVRTYVHPYDRDYQEDLALELTPIIIDAIEELHLSSTVAYRTAELYIKAHTAGIVQGGAHERTIAAALRIATIEADSPRPLSDIGHVLDENPKSIRRKFHRLLKETNLSEALDASSLIIHPEQYVSYMATKLGWSDDEELCARVSRLLTEAELDGTSPISEVAAAFYVAMQHSNRHSITQQEIADTAGLSKVTIRNNYRKYT